MAALKRDPESRPPSNPQTGPADPFGQPTQAPPADATDMQGDFGRYRILKKLGQGGMGAVYLAHDTQLDRKVALKVPHLTSTDPQVLRRFLQEARAAATIEHPNICPVYDVGEVGGRHYVTLAYIEGQPLSKLARGETRLPQAQVAALVRKLALALDEAHKKGVIHRDLKPANIMINQRREPVIMDFGLARRTAPGEERITRDGMILGTPAYMPPEQVNGDLLTMGPASDVYSLGVVLYEMLTGRLPFEGPITAVLGRILSESPPPPSTHRPDLDPALEAICLRAISKKPSDRYPSMADFAAALDGYLRGASPGQAETVTAPALAPAVAHAVAHAVAGSAATDPGGLATQLLARLLGRMEQTSATPAEQGRQLRRTLLLAAIGGGLLVAVVVLLFLLLGGKQATTVTVRLEGLPPLDAQVIVLIDGEQIDAVKLGEFLVLKLGEHELVIRRADGGLIERRRFVVAAGDDRKTIELPPAEPGPVPPRPAVVLPAGKGPFRRAAGSFVEDIAFTHDGTRMATACRDGTVVVWDVGSRKEEIVLRHPAGVDCVVFTPDGKEVIASDAQKQVIVWKLADSSKRLVLAHPERVRGLAVSPDGRTLFGGSTTQKLWSLADGAELATFRSGEWPMRTVVYSPNGTLTAAVAHNAKTVRLWDIPRRKTLPALGPVQPTLLSLDFSPDSSTLAIGSTDGKVNLWDPLRQKVRTALPAAPGPVTHLYYNPTGKLLIGVTKLKVILWDVETEKLLPTTDPGASFMVCTLAPDGKTLAHTGSKGLAGEVYLLDVETLRAKAP
jgi:predicted Ser/Thr protein kinase